MMLSKLKRTLAVLGILVLLGWAVVATAFALQNRFSPADLAEKPPARNPDRTQDESTSRKSTDRESAKKYTIQPNDVIQLDVGDPIPDHPIKGLYRVEPTGHVALGALYGRILLQDLSLMEAEEKLKAHLSKFIKPPIGLMITLPLPTENSPRITELESRVEKLEVEVQRLRNSR